MQNQRSPCTRQPASTVKCEIYLSRLFARAVTSRVPIIVVGNNHLVLSHLLSWYKKQFRCVRSDQDYKETTEARHRRSTRSTLESRRPSLVRQESTENTDQSPAAGILSTLNILPVWEGHVKHRHLGSRHLSRGMTRVVTVTVVRRKGRKAKSVTVTVRLVTVGTVGHKATAGASAARLRPF